VYSAVSLLQKITRGESFDVAQSAVVIGGGNVAMDIARSLARLQTQQYGQVQVILTALEKLDDFLADPEEIKEALEEGVEIIDARGPQRCQIDKHQHLHGLVTLGVQSIFDEDGRFSPRYDIDDECLHEAGMIVEAIGQMSDVSLLDEALTEKLQWNRGRLQVDEAGRTSENWLWAAGDMVNGPDVVHAVADGHRVADSIDNALASLTQKHNGE